MATRYVDLRREADLGTAKERLIAEAMLQGLEANGSVSRAGVMLYGDEHKINVFLFLYDGRDVPPRKYDPDQVGDTEEMI